ncbi:sugar nucleotide-binding protein [Rubrivivax sp. RP6-9]|uniref:sugar nucleotide-binding protein n=1 Tax=Rubrivivax sp. RP6-9 TaxID=3415750 RepID=UPI003CC6AD44
MSALELWAGPECTVNRVGDVWRDQLEETGFAGRLDDIDRIASLGIRRMRLPLLWERCATADAAVYDWRWTDARIERLQVCRMDCVAGLVHHGSGPAGTHLLDPGFAAGLAAYAGAVARRYPQLQAYTPVNEPMTTARFSGLYGAWYPHRRDDRSFVRALLNQLRATVLAMRAIRAVNPAAQLVQTDDLGYTHATTGLQYQADFENHRRWLGFDLLCGRVDRAHPLWRYLRRHGAGEDELFEFVDGPCPPELIGINHYVTSQRFLDDRLDLHPTEVHGGNGRHRYVDVETVRVRGDLLDGVALRLQEAWQRYRRPLALTEAHLGCTREEQLRWLQQTWDAAQSLRNTGVDVRAVTAWAAFGTVDWNTLVTQKRGHYEPGLWDVRGTTPRPTALAHLARQLAQGSAARHPVADGHGWWQRSIRHVHPAFGAPRHLPMRGPPMLIAGARGALGQAFAHLCHLRGLPCRLLSRADLDIADEGAVETLVAHQQPWAFVNAAGFVRVDEAQTQPRQWRENVLGPAALARVCARHGVKLMSFSSDLVFDGTKDAAYVESDGVNPLNAYGEAKAHAERSVLHHDPAALVVRTAAFFGPWDRNNFLTQGLCALAEGQSWPAVADQVVSPTYLRDLVMNSLDLLIDGESGVWHLANQGSASWYELALCAARLCQLDTGLIEPVEGHALGQVALRPRQAALVSERGTVMPTLDDALLRYVTERGADVLPRAEAPVAPASETVDEPVALRRVA